MSELLNVKNVHAKVGEKEILKGVDLRILAGEVHVIMGPNGSGKSTLANVLMGHPKFTVSGGEITFDGKNILKLKPEDRAQLGMFMAFQYPREIAGVEMNRMLYMAYKNKGVKEGEQETDIIKFNEKIKYEAEKLNLKPELSERSVNQGFSGGEKKKSEMLQLAVLEPRFAILDETDSGLDIDALKVVGQAINRYRSVNRSILLVTHYNRILQYLKPDFIHVMIDGKIVATGGEELAKELEDKGYEKYVR